MDTNIYPNSTYCNSDSQKTKHSFKDAGRRRFLHNLVATDERLVDPRWQDFCWNIECVRFLTDEGRRAKKKRKKRNHNQRTRDHNQYAQIARDIKREEADRLAKGYFWHGNDYIGGDANAVGVRQASFLETDLRSTTHPVLGLFLTKLPKKNRSSYRKDIIDDVPSKLLARDLPYIECNKQLIGIIRVDVDAWFETWDHVRLELLDHIPAELLPQIACAWRHSHSEIFNPHLIWLLPQESGVWTGDGANQKPISLYKKVMHGLNSMLSEIGADPGGMLNPLRVKNPLSPHCDTKILNQGWPLTLEELADWIPDRHMSVNRNKLYADAVEEAGEKDGLQKVESNQAFDAFSRIVRKTLLDWHESKNALLTLDDRDALARNLEESLASDARSMMPHCTQQAHGILAKVCIWTANEFDPSKVNRERPNEGIMKPLLEDVEGVRARQSEGGMYAREKVAESTLNKVADAIINLGGIGQATKREVAVSADVSLSTVKRRWKQAEQLIQDRYAEDIDSLIENDDLPF